VAAALAGMRHVERSNNGVNIVAAVRRDENQTEVWQQHLKLTAIKPRYD